MTALNRFSTRRTGELLIFALTGNDPACLGIRAEDCHVTPPARVDIKNPVVG
ncbi:hypothetical protein [Glutamicibacter sp. Je.9.36]|uniref:hypothetical protein n=1 Tax=Glutamicibacter sp. Je.9.36 TaxID=3142837 RepID=UPI003DA95AA7